MWDVNDTKTKRCFLDLGLFHGVRSGFTKDASESAVGPILLMTNKDGTHNGFRNFVSKFTSHTVQKPQN
jgi:hypothetical protein